MDKIKNLERLIAESSAITVAVHTHPDGDALGSGLALAGFLRDCLGKDAVLALPDSQPQSLSFLIEENASIGSSACIQCHNVLCHVKTLHFYH